MNYKKYSVGDLGRFMLWALNEGGDIVGHQMDNPVSFGTAREWNSRHVTAPNGSLGDQ